VASFRAFYRRTYVYYLLFGCLAYSFIYSFSDALLPLVFGSKYAMAAEYTRQMFLTMVVFPTAFLQGNVLFAMRLERRDMWFNLVLLVLNVTICLVGLAYVSSLAVITAALVISFVVFHLLQDVLLIRLGVSSVRHALISHASAVAFVVSYSLLAGRSSSYLVFLLYWSGVLLIAAAVMRNDVGLRAYLGRALASVRL
jgi:O-antigen/teichoic acid export membrane protein